MAKRWNYCGDINLEHGGFFWQESGCVDHVYIVEVTPYSDMGGADNLYLIDKGSVYLPVTDIHRLESVLNIIGKTIKDASRLDIVVAFKAYHGIDSDHAPTTVQIGKELDPYTTNHNEPVSDVVLRGNAKLKNYVRREFLNLT